MSEFSTAEFFAARDGFHPLKAESVKEWQKQADRAQAAGFEVQGEFGKGEGVRLAKNGQPVADGKPKPAPADDKDKPKK